MHRLLFLALLIAQAALLGSPGLAPTQAQKKDKGPDKGKPITITAEERQFLLYAMENLYLQLPDAVAVSTSRPGTASNGRFVSPTNGLAAFVKQQEMVFDLLRRHVQKGDDREIEALFALYRKQLDEYNAFNKQIQQTTLEFQKKVAMYQRGANDMAMASGLAYALRSVAKGGDAEDVLMSSFLGMARTQFEVGVKLKLYTEAERSDYEDNCKNVSKAYKDKIDTARMEFRTKMKSMLESDTSSDKNPFLIIARAQSVLKQPDVTWKDLLEQARICQAAVKLVPPGEVYDIYRAMFLGAGGVLANTAAIKDAGAIGIPSAAKDVPIAGPVARTIWNEYMKVEYNPKRTTRKDFSDDFFQAYLLAHVYAGEAATLKTGIILAEMMVTTIVQDTRINPIYKEGRVVDRRRTYTLRRDFSPRYDFWYDCARVASLLGNTPLAIECLNTAVALGFRDAVEAKASPELRNVREDQYTSTRFKQLFP